jgi:hypothetical protein
MRNEISASTTKAAGCLEAQKHHKRWMFPAVIEYLSGTCLLHILLRKRVMEGLGLGFLVQKVRARVAESGCEIITFYIHRRNHLKARTHQI